MYASAQSLDFLAMTKNTLFPNLKPIVSHPLFPDGNQVTRRDVHFLFWKELYINSRRFA